jgi:hypothetical protein
VSCAGDDDGDVSTASDPDVVAGARFTADVLSVRGLCI